MYLQAFHSHLVNKPDYQPTCNIIMPKQFTIKTHDDSYSPLHHLSPDVVIIPPRRITTESAQESPESGYHDCIAIDIVLLPNITISQHIITTLNVPLRALSPLELNESHFPHMSLLHTIVRVHDLPLICAVVKSVVNNEFIPVLDILHCWKKRLYGGKHPFYETVKSDTSNSEEFHLKPTPWYIESMKNNVNTAISLLFEQIQQAKPCDSSLLRSFVYDKAWPGPCSSPYVGYNNPKFTLTNQDSNITCANGTNIRILHDIITTLLSIFRVDIDEVIYSPITNHCDTTVSYLEMDDHHRKLHDIAQTVFFTGDTIVPLTIQIPFNNEEENIINSQYNDKNRELVDYVIDFNNILSQNGSQTIKALIPSHLNKSRCIQSILHGHTTTDPQFIQYYYSPHPFDQEPADFTNVQYTARFDLMSRGERYNPHITVGGGNFELVKEAWAGIYEKERFCPQNGSYYLGKMRNSNGEEKDDISILFDLAECTIGVFQLGYFGSCRFPIFKTHFNLEQIG